MEGLYFEVKPKDKKAPAPPRPHLSSTHRSCPSLTRLDSTRKQCSSTYMTCINDEGEEEVQYSLTLTGSLLVHRMTTMAMLPWVVAEICKSSGRRGRQTLAQNQYVLLCVSATRVRCVTAWPEGVVRDPLRHMVLFECRPHQVTKLIHNSQEPSSFACLLRDALDCCCYVFRSQDRAKVGEVTCEELC